MFYFFYVIFIVLLVLGNIQPHKNYNYIIIPVSKQPSRTNYITLPYKKPLAQIDSADRIDIENYEEPTEMPNIDYFDYMKDRDASDHEDLSLNREEFLKYLVKANRQPKKHKKYDMTGILRDDELPTDDYESLYGDNKIVGGMEVDINLYPYHAAYGSNCGGAIIDAKWVLTAGHCGVKEYVRVGSKYMNQGTKVAVKAHYIHPQWDARKKQHPFDFDFQLLELAQSLEIGDNIQPVKIARIEDMVIGKVITVTGWGNTREDGPYSYILRAVRVPIISKENCQHVPFPYFRGALTPRMFCAGFSEGKKDACQGDSGGPAVAYGRLLGMVSFGYGCATPGSYGVYSKVARVRPWIEETTGLKLD